MITWHISKDNILSTKWEFTPNANLQHLVNGMVQWLLDTRGPAIPQRSACGELPPTEANEPEGSGEAP